MGEFTRGSEVFTHITHGNRTYTAEVAERMLKKCHGVSEDHITKLVHPSAVTLNALSISTGSSSSSWSPYSEEVFKIVPQLEELFVMYIVSDLLYTITETFPDDDSFHKLFLSRANATAMKLARKRETPQPSIEEVKTGFVNVATDYFLTEFTKRGIILRIETVSRKLGTMIKNDMTLLSNDEKTTNLVVTKRNHPVCTYRLSSLTGDVQYNFFLSGREPRGNTSPRSVKSYRAKYNIYTHTGCPERFFWKNYKRHKLSFQASCLTR